MLTVFNVVIFILAAALFIAMLFVIGTCHYFLIQSMLQKSNRSSQKLKLALQSKRLAFDKNLRPSFSLTRHQMIN